MLCSAGILAGMAILQRCGPAGSRRYEGLTVDLPLAGIARTLRFDGKQPASEGGRYKT